MPQKSKCSPEEKELAVKDYLNGVKGTTQILNELGIDNGTLRRWVALYKGGGVGALTPKVKNKCYPKELKLKVVEEYLSGQTSLLGLVSKYNITDIRVVRRWIEQYNSHGEFKSKKSGSEIYMAKARNTTFEERQEIVAYCLSQKTDYRAAMEKYGVSYAQITRWVKRFNEGGPDALEDRRGRRKPTEELTEVESLKREIKELKTKLYEQQIMDDIVKKLEEVERRRS